MSVIYEPRGKAYEYAHLACNLFRGCVHGCTYCYAPACLFMGHADFSASMAPRPNILKQLRAEAPRYSGTKDHVLFCFTCDPYQPGEDGLTRKALQIMRENRVPFEVLTKGGTRAVRDLDLFTGCDSRFGTTLIFTEDEFRREWEPGAASIEDRIEALKAFHDAGVWTWVSIEPVIDTKQAIDLVEMLSPWVDFWKVGKLNHHPLARQIDWVAFRKDIFEALTGKHFLLKQDLIRA